MSIIKNSMYKGSVELVFDIYKHRYTWNDEVIPGSTSVLGILAKPALIFWSANMAADYFKSQITPGKALDEMEIDAIWQQAKKAHTQKKNDSATLGTFVHKFIEQYIKGENPSLPSNSDIRGAVERFFSWVEQHHVEFLSSEQAVFSKQYKYAGTADFMCKIDGKLWLGDIKTSAGIYDEYWMQTSSYLEARTEEFNEGYEGVVIVRVGKTDGDLEVKMKTRQELFPYFDLFLNCLGTYNAMKKLEAIK